MFSSVSGAGKWAQDWTCMLAIISCTSFLPLFLVSSSSLPKSQGKEDKDRSFVIRWGKLGCWSQNLQQTKLQCSKGSAHMHLLLPGVVGVGWGPGIFPELLNHISHLSDLHPGREEMSQWRREKEDIWGEHLNSCLWEYLHYKASWKIWTGLPYM